MKIDITIATDEVVQQLAEWPLIQHGDWSTPKGECPFCRKTELPEANFYHVETCLVLAAQQELKRRRQIRQVIDQERLESENEYVSAQ